jgi:erythrin-vacuolar iron transport family protein
MPKNFKDLSEREILALAISLEEEDIRTYSDLAEAMRENYPGTARMFAAMSEEENGHRHRLLDLYRTKFGNHIPLIRRQDVKASWSGNRSGCSVRGGLRRCAPKRS